MAKKITDEMGGWLNDYSFLDFITVSMYMAFFIMWLEYLHAVRAKPDTDEKWEDILNKGGDLIDKIKDRMSKVGSGKNAGALLSTYWEFSKNVSKNQRRRFGIKEGSTVDTVLENVGTGENASELLSVARRNARRARKAVGLK